MFEIQRMRRWDGIRIQPYEYTGSDGRKVIDYIFHLGFFRLIKYRIACYGVAEKSSTNEVDVSILKCYNVG